MGWLPFLFWMFDFMVVWVYVKYKEVLKMGTTIFNRDRLLIRKIYGGKEKGRALAFETDTSCVFSADQVENLIETLTSWVKKSEPMTVGSLIESLETFDHNQLIQISFNSDHFPIARVDSCRFSECGEVDIIVGD